MQISNDIINVFINWKSDADLLQNDLNMNGMNRWEK